MVLGISLIILLLLLLWCSRNEVVKQNFLRPIKYSVTGSESGVSFEWGEREMRKRERSVGLKDSVA